MHPCGPPKQSSGLCERTRLGSAFQLSLVYCFGGLSSPNLGHSIYAPSDRRPDSGLHSSRGNQPNPMVIYSARLDSNLLQQCHGDSSCLTGSQQHIILLFNRPRSSVELAKSVHNRHSLSILTLYFDQYCAMTLFLSLLLRMTLFKYCKILKCNKESHQALLNVSFASE